MAVNKLVSLHDAVSKVQDGDILFLGGIVDGRRPMAAMYEIMRQKKKNLIGLSFAAFEDMLVGAECLAGGRLCYTHMGIFGKAPCVHRKIAEGKFVVDETGHIDAQAQLMAGAYGFPYIASQNCLGSDIIHPALDRSEELRALARNKDKIPSKKYIFKENPFKEGELDVLMPAMRPDVAIIHVGQASASGTCRIDGCPGVDLSGAFASDFVIITADEIVSEEYLRRDPNRNLLPSNVVDMVVECPYGAHPSLNPGYYDLDMPFVFAYQKAAKTEETFKAWCDEWVYGVEDHEAYLEKLGFKHLNGLKTMKPYGFRPKASLEK